MLLIISKENTLRIMYTVVYNYRGNECQCVSVKELDEREATVVEVLQSGLMWQLSLVLVILTSRLNNNINLIIT